MEKKVFILLGNSFSASSVYHLLYFSNQYLEEQDDISFLYPVPRSKESPLENTTVNSSHVVCGRPLIYVPSSAEKKLK